MTALSRTNAASNTPGGLLHLFPFSYPDELHASQASRHHFHSGNRDITITFRELYDCRPFRLTRCIPPGIERFAAKLPGASTKERLTELLVHNTLAPLFEIFSGIAISNPLVPSDTPSGTKIVTKRVVGEIGNVRLCLDCLKDDLAEYGDPYIHRSHQIPGISCCHRHGTELVTRCPSCRQPFESIRHTELVLAPWQRCVCGTKLSELAQNDSATPDSPEEVALARFAMEMLNLPSRPIAADLLAQTYRAKLFELGFNRQSNIDRGVLYQALLDHYGEPLLLKTDYALRTEKNQMWLRHHTRSGTHDAPIPRHLLLANYLFRSGKAFWAAVAHQEGLSRARPTHPSARSPRQPSEGVKESVPKETSEERQAIQKVLAGQPDWTLDDLWNNYRGLLRRLLKSADKDENLAWLQSLVSQPVQSQRLTTEPPHANDGLWATRIESSALAHYRSTDLPIKLTRNRLLKMAGWKTPASPDPVKYPATTAKLTALVESTWHYYARRVLWSRILNGGPNVAAYRIVEAVTVEYYRGKDLVARFASMPYNVPMVTGVILEWLERFQIPIHWSGPEKQDHYDAQGRRYTPRRKTPRHA